MQQKTLIALGALAAIILGAYLTLHAPEKGQRMGPPPRPIPALKAADVKELELSADGGKNHVVLKLDGGSWKLTVPAAHNADQQAVKTALEQLEKTTFADIVTENVQKFGELEVSDDKGAHVVAKDGAGKAIFDGWLGKASSGFTLLRPAGKNEVWQASGLFKYTYNKDAKAWRDHTIFEFAKADVSKLAIETLGAGAQKVVLEPIPPAPDAKGPEKTADPKWKVLESTVKLDPLDDSVPGNLIQSLSNLRAADFDDAAKGEDVGLSPPRMKVTATVKGQPKTLLVGKQKGDDSWVAVEGQPQIYLVQKYLLERIAVAPRDLRDKTLVKAKEGDLTEIDLTVGTESITLKHEANAWKPVKGTADDAKLRTVVGSFDNLQGSSFAESVDPKVTGMLKLAGAVTLKLRDKSQITLKIGGIKDGTDYYVQKLGSPDVLLVKKYAIDRFLKKPSELAKPSTPPPAVPGMGGPGGMMPQGMPPGM